MGNTSISIARTLIRLQTTRNLPAMFSCSMSLLLVLGFAAVMIEGAAPQCKHRGEHKLPDPDSCRHYYQCKDGIATRATCSWYLYFDNVVMDCQPMWAIDCNAIPPEYPPKAWRLS